MSDGIKIVIPGSSTGTHNPRVVTLDSKEPGSLKVSKVMTFKQSDATTTYLNSASITVGKFIYAHNLGYSPAFLAFSTIASTGVTTVLPASGPIGGPELEAYSDPTNITVDGLVPSGVELITLVIFAENLDAVV